MTAPSQWLRTMRNFSIAAALAMVVTVSAGMSKPNPNPANMAVPNPVVVPTDASPTCTVSPTTFATWFKSGTVALNGQVDPANSVTFPNVPNCSFYRWSEQMFLWLTSPIPSRIGPYAGGGGHVFDSPVFYDVTPPDASGTRTFVAHTSGLPINLAVRNAKVGINGLQLVIDKTGVFREVVPAKIARSGRQLILNRAGAEVEIQSAKIAPNGTPIFMDRAGKVIASPRPIIPARFLTPALMRSKVPAGPGATARAVPLQRFIVNRVPVFLTSSGAVVGVEQGQADSGVLRAQNGSLVYYATMVNDVYAYFLTGQKNAAIAATQFPTTAGELSQIVSYAASKGKTFPDPNALTVEVKTSWIEAAGLSNLGSFITMTATIPQYDTTSNTT